MNSLLRALVTISFLLRPKDSADATQLLLSQYSPAGFSRNTLNFESPKGQQSFVLEILEEDVNMADPDCKVSHLSFLW